jgi:hypothetical protein
MPVRGVARERGLNSFDEIGNPFNRILTCIGKQRHFDQLTDPNRKKKSSHSHFCNASREAGYIKEWIGDR